MERKWGNKKKAPKVDKKGGVKISKSNRVNRFLDVRGITFATT